MASFASTAQLLVQMLPEYIKAACEAFGMKLNGEASPHTIRSPFLCSITISSAVQSAVRTAIFCCRPLAYQLAISVEHNLLGDKRRGSPEEFHMQLLSLDSEQYAYIYRHIYAYGLPRVWPNKCGKMHVKAKSNSL